MDKELDSGRAKTDKMSFGGGVDDLMAEPSDTEIF